MGGPRATTATNASAGAHTASYFNSPSVTLPAAARTGHFTLVSDAVVSHVVMDREGRASGVHYFERSSRRHREAQCKSGGAGGERAGIHAHPA